MISRLGAWIASHPRPFRLLLAGMMLGIALAERSDNPRGATWKLMVAFALYQVAMSVVLGRRAAATRAGLTPPGPSTRPGGPASPRARGSR